MPCPVLYIVPIILIRINVYVCHIMYPQAAMHVNSIRQGRGRCAVETLDEGISTCVSTRGHVTDRSGVYA